MRFWKQKTYEWNNKAGKLLANILDKRRQKRYIFKLVRKGQIFTKNSDIKRIITDYYMDLYKEKKVSVEQIEDYLEDIELTPFTEEQREMLNGLITRQEVIKAIKKAKDGKTPGNDGLSNSYYKIFQNQLVEPLCETINHILEGGIPSSWLQAQITLIPKENKDATDPSNYRPISLLNSDYKLFTSILSDRLKKILSTWIGYEQRGFLPNRYIKDNIRHLLNLIEIHDKNIDRELLMIFVDYEKAFDSVNWLFILKVLEKINAGENFIKWIQAIYQIQKAQTVINDDLSEEIKIERGTRQGCPIYPLLFNLILEGFFYQDQTRKIY